MLNAFNLPCQSEPLPGYKGPSGSQGAKGCTTKRPGAHDVTEPKSQKTHESVSPFESGGMASQIIVNFERALLNRLRFHVC